MSGHLFYQVQKGIVSNAMNISSAKTEGTAYEKFQSAVRCLNMRTVQSCPVISKKIQV